MPKRQVENLVVRAARDFDEFYDQRQEVQIEQVRGLHPDRLVVLSTDGKGIVMRHDALREETRKRAKRSATKLTTRISPGEKRNRKRMAEVATVYELELRPRTPAHIIRVQPGLRQLWAA